MRIVDSYNLIAAFAGLVGIELVDQTLKLKQNYTIFAAVGEFVGRHQRIGMEVDDGTEQWSGILGKRFDFDSMF